MRPGIQGHRLDLREHAYVEMVYCKISVSPGMIDTMTRTGGWWRYSRF